MASELVKSYQYLNFDILENTVTALWLLLLSCFWSMTDWFGEIKQFHKPWNYGASDTHAFYVFAAFLKNLKSSFSEDNMPIHAFDVSIENATKMV